MPLQNKRGRGAAAQCVENHKEQKKGNIQKLRYVYLFLD